MEEGQEQQQQKPASPAAEEEVPFPDDGIPRLCVINDVMFMLICLSSFLIVFVCRSLEMQFGTFANAAEAANSLRSLRDDLKVKHLGPEDSGMKYHV